MIGLHSDNPLREAESLHELFMDLSFTPHTVFGWLMDSDQRMTVTPTMGKNNVDVLLSRDTDSDTRMRF